PRAGTTWTSRGTWPSPSRSNKGRGARRGTTTMRHAHPVEVVRAAERPLIEAARAVGDPDAVMRRAAAGLAHHTAALVRERAGGLYGRSVLLVVGPGDNGGDALYAGAALRGRGCRVDAVLLDSSRAHARGLAALRRAGGRTVTARAAVAGARPDVAVDGVVGLGDSGALREPAAGLVAALTGAGVPWVAVDLPSGVDADTGTAHREHVRADVTVTFGVARRAQLLGSQACGRVEEVGRSGPVLGPGDDKYTQGVVAVRAGSERYPGAAVLTVSAAVAATSGMVRYVGSGSGAVLSARPEVVCHTSVAEAGRAQAWV